MTAPFFFGCVATATGGFVLAGVTRDLGRAMRSKSWPDVEGVVTVSSVVKERIDDMDVLRENIRYTYAACGSIYTGRRVRFVNLGTGNVAGVVARYPVGKPVRVFYCPSNPSLSVLEPGANWFQYIGLPAGLAFIAAGIAMMIQGRK